ncbi:MAG: GntR family transcriptional regulator [Schumannella sp.]
MARGTGATSGTGTTVGTGTTGGEARGRRAAIATQTLRARIASGEWPVGSRIPTEPELCELLGVGRSTVREAVRALATLGMLEPLTARGTFVRAATPIPALLTDSLAAYDPVELVGLRRALDVDAAQTAAARRSSGDLELLEAELHDETARPRAGDSRDAASHCSRFHGIIARAGGGRLMADLDAALASAFRTAGLDERIASGTDVAVRIDEHDRILTAIRGRDVGIAAHLMALHVDAALRSVSHEPVVTELTTLVASPRSPRTRPRSARAS